MENEKEYVALDDERLEQVLGGAKNDKFKKRADGNCPYCETIKLVNRKVYVKSLLSFYQVFLYCPQCERVFMEGDENLTDLGAAKLEDGELVIYVY